MTDKQNIEQAALNASMDKSNFRDFLTKSINQAFVDGAVWGAKWRDENPSLAVLELVATLSILRQRNCLDAPGDNLVREVLAQWSKK